MRISLKLVVVTTLIVVPVNTGMAASKSPKLARCDGKQRRPANLYGSILPTVDPANGTVSPTSSAPRGVDVFPQSDPAKPDPRDPPRPPDPPLPRIPPISFITPPTSFGSC